MIVTADHYFQREVCCADREGLKPLIDDRVCAIDLGLQLSRISTLCLRPAKMKRFACTVCRIPRPRALGIFTGLVEAVHEYAGLTNRGLIIVD